MSLKLNKKYINKMAENLESGRSNDRQKKAVEASPIATAMDLPFARDRGARYSFLDWDRDEIFNPKRRDRLWAILALFFEKPEFLVMMDVKSSDVQNIKDQISSQVWQAMGLTDAPPTQLLSPFGQDHVMSSLNKIIFDTKNVTEMDDSAVSKTVTSLRRKIGSMIGILQSGVQILSDPKEKLKKQDLVINDFENAFAAASKYWDKLESILYASFSIDNDTDMTASLILPNQIRELLRNCQVGFSGASDAQQTQALINEFFTAYGILLKKHFSMGALQTQEITPLEFDLARAPLKVLMAEMEMQAKKMPYLKEYARRFAEIFSDFFHPRTGKRTKLSQFFNDKIDNESPEGEKMEFFSTIRGVGNVTLSMRAKEGYSAVSKMLRRIDFHFEDTIRDAIGFRVATVDIENVLTALLHKIQFLSNSEEHFCITSIESKGNIDVEKLKAFVEKEEHGIKFEHEENNAFSDVRIYGTCMIPEGKRKRKMPWEIQIVHEDNNNEIGASHTHVYKRAAGVEVLARLLPHGIPENMMAKLIIASCFAGETTNNKLKAIELGSDMSPEEKSEKRRMFRKDVIRKQFLRYRLFYDPQRKVYYPSKKPKAGAEGVENEQFIPVYPIAHDFRENEENFQPATEEGLQRLTQSYWGKFLRGTAFPGY